jgi:hypothetical protein
LTSNSSTATKITLITPNNSGEIDPVAEGGVIPVSAYVEATLPANVSTIPDVYSDYEKTLQIEKEIISASRNYGDAINEIADPGNIEGAEPLTYDLTLQLAAVAADRAIRLAEIGVDGMNVTLSPSKVSQTYNFMGRADDWRTWQKKQSYQWLILRLLAGAEDDFQTQMPSIYRRYRTKLGKWRQDRIAAARGGNGMHSCYLARHKPVMDELAFPLTEVPSLVLDHGTQRDAVKRQKIEAAGEVTLAPLIEACGIVGRRAKGLGKLMGRLYPESRLECRSRNGEAYQRYFDRWNVDGMITATGHTWHDPSAFFWTECNHRNLPTVILQHGGQYGYDDKQPGFFALDQTLPTKFVSWGWDKYSSAFDDLDRRAHIIPLPDPRLSSMKGGWRPDQKRENLLIVPLSKFRSLEVRFGSIANDGRLLSLRQTAANVIERCASDFDKIIVTYRGASFDTDPLNDLLANYGDRVEVLSSNEVPASQLFERASAVFWDVTATGPFESLTYKLPTVVLMRSGRWAKDAAWAEELFIKSGVGAYNADEAGEKLVHFSHNPSDWTKALSMIQPVLQFFALSKKDWRKDWMNFLGSLNSSVHT